MLGTRDPFWNLWRSFEVRGFHHCWVSKWDCSKALVASRQTYDGFFSSFMRSCLSRPHPGTFSDRKVIRGGSMSCMIPGWFFVSNQGQQRGWCVVRVSMVPLSNIPPHLPSITRDVNVLRFERHETVWMHFLEIRGLGLDFFQESVILSFWLLSMSSDRTIYFWKEENNLSTTTVYSGVGTKWSSRFGAGCQDSRSAFFEAR